MATYLTTYYGNTVTAGSKQFRVVAELYSTQENSSSGYYLQVKYYVQVLVGQSSAFTRYFKVSWNSGTDYSLSTAGTYATKTVDLGWVGYGSSKTVTASGQYEGSSGTIYKSSLSGTYTVPSSSSPSTPTTGVSYLYGNTTVARSIDFNGGKAYKNVSVPNHTGTDYVTYVGYSGWTSRPGIGNHPEYDLGISRLSDSTNIITNDLVAKMALMFGVNGAYHSELSALVGASGDLGYAYLQDVISYCWSGDYERSQTINIYNQLLSYVNKTAADGAARVAAMAGYELCYYNLDAYGYDDIIWLEKLRTKVTFDPNGGVLAQSGTNENLYTYGRTNYVYLTHNSGNYGRMSNDLPTRIGYSFNGWYTAKSGGTKVYDNTGYVVKGTSYFNSSGASISTATAYTLYAQWTANTYVVQYMGNGNTSGSTVSSSHTYDTAKTLTTNGFVKDGYNFIGWNTKADGSGVSYSNGASVSNLTSTNNETITLYAQWDKNSCILTLDPNGGKVATKSLTLSNGTSNYSDISWNIPSKIGYDFTGWYTATSGGIQVYDSAGLVVNDGTYWKDGCSIYNSSYTLYAQWEEVNDYDIYIYSNLSCSAIEFIESDTMCGIDRNGRVYAASFIETDKAAIGSNMYFDSIIER